METLDALALSEGAAVAMDTLTEEQRRYIRDSVVGAVQA